MTIPELIQSWRDEAEHMHEECESPDAWGMMQMCADELEEVWRQQQQQTMPAEAVISKITAQVIESFVSGRKDAL